MLPKISKKEVKMLFAAHVFVYTSKDGMVISNIINLSPYKLHRLTKSPNWTKCLAYWNYTGDPTLTGELYRKEVGRGEEKNNLRIASRLWKEVFSLKPVRALLYFFRD